MTASFIYFLTPIKGGPIKIGCSAKPLSRLEIFMAWSPVPLKLLGSTPGTLKDEAFIHKCFADCHSHGEWFRAEPHLRAAIALMIADGIEAIRPTLSPKGSIKKKRKPRTPDQSACQSYAMRVDWAERKLRGTLSLDGTWHAPDDVTAIVQNWRQFHYGHAGCLAPNDAERARLDEYLSNPVAHSVVPAWRRPKVAA